MTLTHPFQQFRAYLPLVFITLGYFIAMNLFEAGQQLYYIKRFSLAQETVTYFELLKNHFFRWLVWFVFTLPFVHFILKNRITQTTFTLPFLAKYLLVIIASLMLTIACISCMQILQDGGFREEFGEYFQFFFAQKFTLFFSSYLGVVILVHLFMKQRELEGQTYEFLELQEKYEQVSSALITQKKAQPITHISIKIGDQLKLIPITEITYIQSADYCVQIHTKSNRSYFLRQSMKAMENRLKTKGFIRIHRHTIINFSMVTALRFNPKAAVVLHSGEVLSIANSRIKEVRQVVHSVS